MADSWKLPQAIAILQDRIDWHALMEVEAEGMDFTDSAKHHAAMAKELGLMRDKIEEMIEGK